MEQIFDTVDAQPVQPIDTPLQDREVIQGRIFWLPSREEVAKNAVKERVSNEELWKREVMRGHSRGAIDERIYSHPVVIVSRPKSQSRVVQFLLITSFRGKTLDEIYDKPNDFHTSRRSWYLPVGPTPIHPDAQSAKTRKRFPTLALGNAALLRKNSYVDIRHIYQIDWSLLEEYTNLEHPHSDTYRFERESFVRMLAKCKTLTEYEPKEQLYKQRPQSRKSSRDDIIDEAVSDWESDRDARLCRPRALSCDTSQPDFHWPDSAARRIPGLSPKIPPDIDTTPIAKFVNDCILHPIEQFFTVCHCGSVAGHQKAMAMAEKPVEIRKLLDKFCRDAKGVAAVTIATFF